MGVFCIQVTMGSWNERDHPIERVDRTCLLRQMGPE